MLPAPILRRELRAAGMRKDLFLLRVICVLVPATVFLIVYWAFTHKPLAQPDSWVDGAISPQQLRMMGMSGFLAIGGSFAMLLFSIGAVASAPVIAAERQKDTWTPLVLSPLNSWQLVGIKLFVPVAQAVSFCLALTPLCALAGSAWGLSAGEFAFLMAALLMTCVFSHLLAFAVGLGALRPDHAQGFAILALMLWIFLPVGGFLVTLSHWPVLYELTLAIRAALRFLGQSSPLSWFMTVMGGGGPSIQQLGPALLATMELQAALTVLLLLYAVWQIRPLSNEAMGKADAPPDWSTPFQRYRWKHRPPVGDDPVYWKDRFVMSLRPRPPQAKSRLGRLLTLLLVCWLLFIAAVFMGGWCIALMASGVSATREALATGYHWGAPGSIFTERFQFYAALAPLGLMIFMIGWLSLGTGTSQFLILERDRKTWDSLITTPLEGTEIMGGKERVILRFARLLLITLGFFYLWGAAIGAMYWPGVIAALVLLRASWRLIARIGIWRGMRSKNANSAAATILAAVFPLGLVVAPLFIAGVLPQSKAREYMEQFGPATLPLYLATTAVATLGLIWANRQLGAYLEAHFDEWIERPNNPAQPEVPPDALEVAGLPASA